MAVTRLGHMTPYNPVWGIKGNTLLSSYIGTQELHGTNRPKLYAIIV